MMEEEVIFYREWLPLDKELFRILAILADCGGSFCGNLSDLCRKLSLTPQTKNRNCLAAAIRSLEEQSFIIVNQQNRTYELRISAKSEEIHVARRWVTPILQHAYSSASVSWEAVLKTLIWITNNRLSMVTDEMIAADLKLSISTIGDAKNVLSKELKAISREIVKVKNLNGEARNIGQELFAVAAWSDE